MKSLYKKGMSLQEIQLASDMSWKRLHDVNIYLNDAGRHAMEAHSIIYDACTFSKDYNELAAEILRLSKEQGADSGVTRLWETVMLTYLKLVMENIICLASTNLWNLLATE